MESASGGRSGAPYCFCNRPRMAAERSPALPPYWSVPCQGRLMKPLGLGSVSLPALFLPPWRRPSASLQARARSRRGPAGGADPPGQTIPPRLPSAALVFLALRRTAAGSPGRLRRPVRTHGAAMPFSAFPCASRAAMDFIVKRHSLHCRPGQQGLLLGHVSAFQGSPDRKRTIWFEAA